MPKQTEVTSDDVLKFWLDACSPADWYKADDAFDSQIRDRFEGAWQNLCDGHYSLWLTHPSGALAYIILADQFPRNMFRGSRTATTLWAAVRRRWNKAMFRMAVTAPPSTRWSRSQRPDTGLVS